jgi:hypothetical protein
MKMNLRQQFEEALRDVPVREYLTDNCPALGRLAVYATDLEQALLQRSLAKCSLSDALVGLYQNQLFKGFVLDTLAQLQRIRIPARDGSGFFLVHRNPGRAARGGGKGRATAPAGIDIQKCPNPTCFLCEWNQKWQQCGLQLGYKVRLDDEEHFCSCNPFPFGQFHATIATSLHRAQRWSDRADLTHVISSIVELSTQLPGWVVLYNGDRSAGASIPAHRHYQTFKVHPSQRPFPLQHAAISKSKKVGSLTTLPLVGGVDYPITCIRASGRPESVRRAVVGMAESWRSLGDDLSENIIALTEDGAVTLYYTPRDQYSHAAGFGGAIASLEILGEFIFSGEQELRALAEGSVDYQWLCEVLRAVAPPAAPALFGNPVALVA